jgi:RNA polymerase sigma-70 factor (ECF subfamily)
MSPSLLRYAASRDETAFHELVREHQGMVYSTCLRVLRHPSAEVDEAVQDTFLKLARSAGEIRGNVAAWLNACAHTTALDRRRRQRSRAWRERELEDDGCDVDDPPSGRHEREDLAAVVWSCVEELPEREREVVTRHYYMRQSQREIAQALNVSQVTVHQRLSGALALLRRRCVRRGIAVGALMALLSASAPGAVPSELATQLARIAPRGAGGLKLAFLAVAAIAGIVGAVLTWIMVDACAERRVLTAPGPSAPSAIAVAHADAAAAPATPVSHDPPTREVHDEAPAWSLSHLTATGGVAELDGEQAPTMRLRLADGAEVGVATLATPLPPHGYDIDFDYCTLSTHCPYSCVTADPGFAGVDPLRDHVRPVTNRDSERSPVGQWRHFRSEWRPMPDGMIRVSTWIDGEPFQRVEVAPPGAAQDRLNLRVIFAEVVVARVRVTALADAAP